MIPRRALVQRHSAQQLVAESKLPRKNTHNTLPDINLLDVYTARPEALWFALLGARRRYADVLPRLHPARTTNTRTKQAPPRLSFKL